MTHDELEKAFWDIVLRVETQESILAGLRPRALALAHRVGALDLRVSALEGRAAAVSGAVGDLLREVNRLEVHRREADQRIQQLLDHHAVPDEPGALGNHGGDVTGAGA